MVFLRDLDDRPVCAGVVGMWGVPLKIIHGNTFFPSAMTVRTRVKHCFSLPEVVKKARGRIPYAGHARGTLKFR